MLRPWDYQCTVTLTRHENFKCWKRQVEVYLAAFGDGQTDKPTILLSCAGSNLVEIYDQLMWKSVDDKIIPEKVLDYLTKYSRDNELLETQETIMRNKIGFSVTRKLQDLLLR